MPVEVVVPVTPALTARVPAPERPPLRCLWAGVPTLCNADMADWLDAYGAALDTANGRLDAVRGMQP